MKLLATTAFAAALQGAQALSNTSPFFLFSTSELLIPSYDSIQSAETVTSSLKSTLSSCPSKHYIFVSQAGVDSDDFSQRQSAPSLSRWLSGQATGIRSSTSIADVVGDMKLEKVEDEIMSRCGASTEEIDISAGSFAADIASSSTPQILKLAFSEPSADRNRADALVWNDNILSTLLSKFSSQNYTVIYTTTPPSPSRKSSSSSPSSAQPEILPSYEWDDMDLYDQEPIHTELKRDVGDIHHRQAGNVTLPDGPLFNRYQFFTPGIFMGFLVALPLILILYVALSAIYSLEVSYGAFDKEMGPQSAPGAGKKQQ